MLGVMARPRKPIEELKLSGAFAKNPNRRRTAPKSTKTIGTPPRYFTDDEKVCWKEILRDSIPGVLTGADRWLVEAACLVMAKMRRREPMNGPERMTLMQAITKAGLSPVDRQRLTGPASDDQPDEEDRLAEFRV